MTKPALCLADQLTTKYNNCEIILKNLMVRHTLMEKPSDMIMKLAYSNIMST